MTPTFYSKVNSYFQNEDVYKKLDQKYSILYEGRAILYDQPFFWLSLKFFFKSHISLNFRILEFFIWILISNYSYQQVINSIS